MILRAPIRISQSKKLTKEHIEENFAARLRDLGFISKNSNTEWYGIINGKLLCSLYFNETHEHDIYYRIQPICCRLLHPLKKNNQGTSDVMNHCESALSRWRKNNPILYDELSKSDEYAMVSDAEFLIRKIEFYAELLEMVVLPYFNKLADFSDIECERDWWIIAASSYLSGDFDSYSKCNAVVKSLTNIEVSSVSCTEDDRFAKAIRKASVEKDPSIVGKYLQKEELENLAYLKKTLPKLFKQNEIFPIITDDYITTYSLNRAVTTEDFGFAIPNDIRKDGFEYVPFPMSEPNSEASQEKAKMIAKQVIDFHCADLLRKKGFVSSDNGFKWHRLTNDIIYNHIEFLFCNNASVRIVYYTCSLFDKIELNAFTKLNGKHFADNEFLKLVGSPITYENYPNPFLSGESVLDWQISRFKCQLHYVVFPAFDAVDSIEKVIQVSDILTMAKQVCNAESMSAIVSCEQQNSVKQYGKIKLPLDSLSWLKQQLQVMSRGDSQYVLYYLNECRKYNKELLRSAVPDLFK